MKPLLAVIVTSVGLFASVLGGVGLSSLLPSNMRQIIGPIAITGIAVALIALYRRFVLHRPWSGVRLTWNRSALPQLLLGLVAAMAAILATNAVSVALGVATWVPYEGSSLAVLVAVLVLGQAFPEELLFRGHLWDVLTQWLSPRAVLAVTTVAFGAIHILSQSQASGLAEKLLYVVAATALGFACGAARQRTGALWAAVGVHTGLHLAWRIFPTEDILYGVQLVVQTAFLTLAALALLLVGRRQAVSSSTAA